MIPPRKRAEFLEAITAYARWCSERRAPYRHPESRWSSVGTRYVFLRNHTHTLARYDLDTGEILYAPTRTACRQTRVAERRAL
jgi:hypothetical protein